MAKPTKPIFLTQRRWYHRVKPLTWVLVALFIADIATPGYMRFDFLLFTLDATNAVESFHHHPHP
ncbi:MAG: hypothetical protein ACFBSG_13335 [Leptolyngbyaceae cyanobacterium]